MSAPFPLENIRPDDVFVVSYPRSGNTWLRFLLGNMLEPRQTVSFRNINVIVPDIYRARDWVEKMPGRRFLKSHHALFDRFPRSVYVYRDGRDVLASYFHYATQIEVYAGTFSEFLRSDFPSYKFGSWRDHIRAAMDFAAQSPKKILLLRYESLLAEPLTAADQIAAFAALDLSRDALADAVEKTSFENLRKNEAQFGSSPMAQGKKVEFFRKGAPGDWRSVFGEDDLAFFLAENAGTMRRLGYGDE